LNLAAKSWTGTIKHNNTYRVAQKSKPLPNYQKNVLHRVKVCQWD